VQPCRKLDGVAWRRIRSQEGAATTTPGAAMVRLYVGGLPTNIAATEVAARFASFGVVGTCDIMPAKGLDAAPGVGRGFAYVEFAPKDEASLKRCLSLVRRCGAGPMDSICLQPWCP
jgi:hypothetical protein